MGIFDSFANIIFAIVAVVVVIALFERSWIVSQAKRKRDRQDRSRREDL
jgi:heme exporter protein D